MSDKAIQSNQTESSDGSGFAAVAGEACDEYNPFLKRRKVTFVKPGEYDPYETGLYNEDGGGWRYDPTGAYGRWTSSYLPPKEGQGNALAEKLLEAEEGAGDLPFVIHDSLQQLRSQLLGDEKQQQQQIITDDDYGQVCEAQLLESTCITITTPCHPEPGNGTAAYQLERYSVPEEAELPQCSGVNTQLNGQSSVGSTAIPTSVQQSLSSRIGKFLKHT
eukprot:TRINITY_DN15595_c0_g1_i1.p1 TRINITY_DN15595_c0_g1~~TRINITY_DN15595_c0_g1_i1.p1  ORF type:complete len:219 (+),score=41.41 TRINITY_DN15595_c0_g1_i1:17-673(+)